MFKLEQQISNKLRTCGETSPGGETPRSPLRDTGEYDTWEIDASEVVVEESLSVGTTAEVFRGSWRGEPVAVKRILRCVCVDPKQLQAFEREVVVLQTARHENLVRLLGVSTRELPLQIITEFCLGGTCFDVLHNSNFEPSWFQRLKMCFDVANAVEYLHDFKPQIIHRDLKSSNLLLAAPVQSRADVPIVKVADFGLSRMKNNPEGGKDSQWGKMTMDVGTFHWMAPEVLTGAFYDEKVDVYSFGMILYEFICRRVPFEEQEPAGAVYLVVQGNRPTLECVPADCPEKYKVLMTTCWNQEPSKRPSFPNIKKWLRILSAEQGFDPQVPNRVVQL